MKSKKGIWEIRKGKNNRVYVECKDQSKIMHPEQLCGLNGLGVYGLEHLKDLATAILQYEPKAQTNAKELSDEELKTELRERLSPELSDSKFEALFVSQKTIDDAIKRVK